MCVDSSLSNPSPLHIFPLQLLPFQLLPLQPLSPPLPSPSYVERSVQRGHDPYSRVQHEEGNQGQRHHQGESPHVHTRNQCRAATVPPFPPLLKLWDIGGQPRFRGMWERYCRGVTAIV